jgi:hypothetical protein
MIRRRPTYLKALSLVAAAGVASATLKRTVAAARPIYGVSCDDEERCAPSCKVVRSASKRSFVVLKTVSGMHAKLGFLAAVLFILA